MELLQEEKYYKFVQPLCAEFLAMVMHTFWGSMFTHPSENPYHNRTFPPQDYASDYVITCLVPALQAGFAVFMFIVLFWKICIINFNLSAISLCFVVTGVLSPWMFIPYVIMQCSGSVVGAAMAQAIKQDIPGPISVAEDANIAAVICHEMIVCGIMCLFAVFTVVQEDYDQATGPLAIGLTVFQGILGGKWIGGSCLNASRAFGPAVVLGDWRLQWVWWVGDFVGAIIFGAIYMLAFAPKEKIWIRKLLKKKSTTSVEL